jgi:hypothetical protein
MEMTGSSSLEILNQNKILKYQYFQNKSYSVIGSGVEGSSTPLGLTKFSRFTYPAAHFLRNSSPSLAKPSWEGTKGFQIQTAPANSFTSGVKLSIEITPW